MRRFKDNGFVVSRIKSNSKSVGKVEMAAPVTYSVSVPPLYIWLLESYIIVVSNPHYGSLLLNQKPLNRKLGIPDTDSL